MLNISNYLSILIMNLRDSINLLIKITCLKKFVTVSVTGRKLSKLVDKSSEDQLLRLSELLFLSKEPRLVKPISVALLRNCSKLLPVNFRSEKVHFKL